MRRHLWYWRGCVWQCAPYKKLWMWPRVWKVISHYPVGTELNKQSVAQRTKCFPTQTGGTDGGSNESLAPTGRPGVELELQQRGQGSGRDGKGGSELSCGRLRQGSGARSGSEWRASERQAPPPQLSSPSLRLPAAMHWAPPGPPAPASWLISVLHSPLSHDGPTLLPPQGSG